MPPVFFDTVEFQNLANLTLTWIGYGTLVGLMAKAIMPGRDPGGSVATVLMGIVGTLIGCAVLKYLYPSEAIEPISMRGFSVGTAGALILLAFYKVLGGYFFVEGGTGVRPLRRRRRRRERSPIFDDDI